jgi:hypothetical protein
VTDLKNRLIELGAARYRFNGASPRSSGWLRNRTDEACRFGIKGAIVIGLIVLFVLSVRPGCCGVSLVAAVHAVENPRNVRTGHAAKGPMQIQKPVVRDLRANGYHFTFADRYDYRKACQMFRLYTRMYGAENACEAARIWNQGVGGMNNRAAWRYWGMVRKIMRGGK